MKASEMVVVGRLANHIEDAGTDYDPYDIAEYHFRRVQRETPQLWQYLYESDLDSREIGDWLYDFLVRKDQSGMSLKNFAADTLDELQRPNHGGFRRSRKHRGRG